MTDKVLFSCQKVEYRKRPGQLHVTSAKLIFFTTDNKQLSISREIISGCVGSKSAPVKAQVSTPAKAYVFVFGDVKQRDAFVAAVQRSPEQSQAVPPCDDVRQEQGAVSVPRSGSTEAQIRALLLARDPNLRRAYQEVVEESQLISSAEFWRSRSHLLELERHSTQSQQVGLSSSMLAQVQPGSQGSSTGTLAFTLSSSAISEILAKHPAVKAAYEDNVPDKVSEQDFWTKYFQSQYFLRARDHFVGAESEESILNPIHDIFSRYEQPEDQPTRERGMKPKVSMEKLVNLTLNESDNEDGDEPGTMIFSSRERERTYLIKEFNKHSKVVLGNAGKHQHIPDIPSNAVEVNEIEMSKPTREVRSAAVDPDVLRATKRALGDQLAMVLDHVRPTSHDMPGIVNDLSQQCRTTDRKSYSQSGFVIFSGDQPDERISDKILTAVRSRSVKATEILRHFWACFPITPESRARMERYLSSLSVLEADITKLKTRLHAANYSVFVPMFDPTMSALQEAVEKALSINAKQATTHHISIANKRIRAQ